MIKIPISAAGLESLSVLSKEGIKSNLTLCFSLNQAILVELIGDIVEVFDYDKFTTQVIAASIRHPLHCVLAARSGAHIATVPYQVLMQMIQHPLTDIGISRFADDWQRVARG